MEERLDEVETDAYNIVDVAFDPLVSGQGTFVEFSNDNKTITSRGVEWRWVACNRQLPQHGRAFFEVKTEVDPGPACFFAVGVAPRADVGGNSERPGRRSKLQSWNFADMGQGRCWLHGPDMANRSEQLTMKQTSPHTYDKVVRVEVDMHCATLTFTGTNGEQLGKLDGITGDCLVPVVGIACSIDFFACLTLLEYGEKPPVQVFTLHLKRATPEDMLNVTCIAMSGSVVSISCVKRSTTLQQFRASLGEWSVVPLALPDGTMLDESSDREPLWMFEAHCIEYQ